MVLILFSVSSLGYAKQNHSEKLILFQAISYQTLHGAWVDQGFLAQ